MVGFVLAPTMYHEMWNALQSAPPARAGEAPQVLSIKENILLLQMRIGILFPLFLAIGIKARGGNAGLHKRMMILATAMALPAGIDRIPWLPTHDAGEPAVGGLLYGTGDVADAGLGRDPEPAGARGLLDLVRGDDPVVR